MYSKAKRPSGHIKVVITGGLGDCLLATPFIRYFKQCGQYDDVWCVVPDAARGIFDFNPHIDRLIACSGSDLLLWAVPEKDGDVFSPYIDAASPETFGRGMQVPFTHILRPNRVSQPIIQQVARYHRIELTDDIPEIFTSEEDGAWAREVLSGADGRPSVFFNPASRLPEKNLPMASALQILEVLLEKYHIFTLPGQDTIDGAVTLEPHPTVRQSAALFAALSVVLTVDSFPAHLAKATGTGAVVLFGPTNPETFGHRENENISAGICPVCADTPRKEDCQHHRCMAAISVSQVLSAVERLAERH